MSILEVYTPALFCVRQFCDRTLSVEIAGGNQTHKAAPHGRGFE